MDGLDIPVYVQKTTATPDAAPKPKRKYVRKTALPNEFEEHSTPSTKAVNGQGVTGSSKLSASASAALAEPITKSMAAEVILGLSQMLFAPQGADRAVRSVEWYTKIPAAQLRTGMAAFSQLYNSAGSLLQPAAVAKVEARAKPEKRKREGVRGVTTWMLLLNYVRQWAVHQDHLPAVKAMMADIPQTGNWTTVVAGKLYKQLSVADQERLRRRTAPFLAALNAGRAAHAGGGKAEGPDSVALYQAYERAHPAASLVRLARLDGNTDDLDAGGEPELPAELVPVPQGPAPAGAGAAAPAAAAAGPKAGLGEEEPGKESESGSEWSNEVGGAAKKGKAEEEEEESSEEPSPSSEEEEDEDEGAGAAAAAGGGSGKGGSSSSSDEDSGSGDSSSEGDDKEGGKGDAAMREADGKGGDGSSGSASSSSSESEEESDEDEDSA